MNIAVVFRPKALGQLNSLFLYYPIDRLAPKGQKREDIELRPIEIKKGVNFIDATEWDAAMRHAPNKAAIDRAVMANAISVYKPDVEDPVGATSDFTSLNVVRDIIGNCTDVNWINRSITRDNRKEVFQMGSERLSELEEEKSLRRDRAMEAV